MLVGSPLGFRLVVSEDAGGKGEINLTCYLFHDLIARSMDDPFEKDTHIKPAEHYAPGMKVFSDRFLLERRIGRGGMGEVWLARDNELGSEVALKFLPKEVAGDPGAVARLRREALAGQALSHPRIVKTHGQKANPTGGEKNTD